MARLRCSSHPLNVETGRHNDIPYDRRFCDFCKEQGKLEIEDEYHFICCCIRYNNLRRTFLPELHTTLTEDSHIELLTSTDVDLVKRVAIYINEGFKIRNLAKSQLP
jgi:hypothetical protein